MFSPGDNKKKVKLSTLKFGGKTAWCSQWQCWCLCESNFLEINKGWVSILKIILKNNKAKEHIYNQNDHDLIKMIFHIFWLKMSQHRTWHHIEVPWAKSGAFTNLFNCNKSESDWGSSPPTGWSTQSPCDLSDLPEVEGAVCSAHPLPSYFYSSVTELLEV